MIWERGENTLCRLYPADIGIRTQARSSVINLDNTCIKDCKNLLLVNSDGMMLILTVTYKKFTMNRY